MSMDNNINPIILAIYVMVVIMLVISGILENACGFLLRGFALVAELCLSQVGPMTPHSDRLLHSIGVDTCHVIKALQLTPNARSYVCCPKCFACYLQTSETLYPAPCTSKKTASSAKCGR
jgi:hypothetical protein